MRSKGVEVGNQWCEDTQVVRWEAKKMFEGRFVTSNDLGVKPTSVDFKFFSLEDSLSLITGFSKE